MTCCNGTNEPDPGPGIENGGNTGENENPGGETGGESGGETGGENGGGEVSEPSKYPQSLAGTSWKYSFPDSPKEFHLVTFVDESRAYYVAGYDADYYWEEIYVSSYSYDPQTGKGTTFKTQTFCIDDLGQLVLNDVEEMVPVEFVPMPEVDLNYLAMQDFMDEYIILQQKFLDAYNATAGNKKYNDSKYDGVKEDFEMVFYNIETARMAILKLAYQYNDEGVIADKLQELYDMFPPVEKAIEQLYIDWEAAVSKIE